MSVEKRTIAGWCHQLNAPDVELTLSEFMARCLLDIRENLLGNRLASEQIEAMVAIFNDVMLEANGEYRRIARQRAQGLSLANGKARDG